MFLTISYISSASQILTSKDIEMLIIDAKVFNNNNNIGGILIYTNQTFFQTIEGEYEDIISLFKKIKSDNRHYGILKILETKSLTRRYERFNSNYIEHQSEKATTELLKFLEIKEEHISDPKLHDLIIYQSKVLLNIHQ